MCPPDYFKVEYVINPWMDGNESHMNLDRARAQWEILRWSISQVADVVTIEPKPGLPDMVFTANAGVVYGNRAIAMNIRGEMNGNDSLGADSDEMGSRISFSYIDQFADGKVGLAVGYARLDAPLATQGFGTYEPWGEVTRAVTIGMPTYLPER